MINLWYAVFVSNEAIYAKATEIRPKEPEMFSSLFLMMGIFYILSMFLGITETRFRDAELKDILIQSKINAGGYIKGVLSGKQYNPLVRSYKCCGKPCGIWFSINVSPNVVSTIFSRPLFWTEIKGTVIQIQKLRISDRSSVWSIS